MAIIARLQPSPTIYTATSSVESRFQYYGETAGETYNGELTIPAGWHEVLIQTAEPISYRVTLRASGVADIVEEVSSPGDFLMVRNFSESRRLILSQGSVGNVETVVRLSRQ